MNHVHIFDLDNTLWTIDSKIWIIDKDKPGFPIIKLSSSEFNLVQNGIFKKDNILIDYNDQKWWISKDIFNRINRKKRVQDPNRLGISFVEYYNDEYIENAKIKYLFYNIQHITGKGEKIIILSGRNNRKSVGNLLNELRLNLKDKDIDIFKIYFVSYKFYYRHNEKISYEKTVTLLEHLIGLKIEDYKFIGLKQDKFDTIYFYDDEIMNIDYANNIQSMFDQVLKNTEDDIFRLVIERIRNHKLTLINNLVMHNYLNPFKTTTVELREPIRFPVYEPDEDIKKLKEFKG
jgi:hypothetical protein